MLINLTARRKTLPARLTSRQTSLSDPDSRFPHRLGSSPVHHAITITANPVSVGAAPDHLLASYDLPPRPYSILYSNSTGHENINFARMRDQTMSSQEEEEAVTVNTRALIDKVLARYSGEWTTLRELIQNAADAQAGKVSIRFETLPSASVPLPQSQDPSDHLRHVLLHHTLKTLLVTNDGEVFGENDWQRLKRIAEGNPDETKIGAFGVGFYSVFADCETPFTAYSQGEGNCRMIKRLLVLPFCSITEVRQPPYRPCSAFASS
ncbi:hypothetical protein KC356_g351 [Hortaea werneckii]|nr:hypothetical protein KC356_g351 [Hortaea werneckii]